MCLIACTLPSPKSHTDLPHCLLGAVSQSWVRCCLLGYSPHFTPNKSDVKLSRCAFFKSIFPINSAVLSEVLLMYDSNVTRYLKFLFYMGVELIYSVVFISGVEQNDSGIHIH